MVKAHPASVKLIVLLFSDRENLLLLTLDGQRLDPAASTLAFLGVFGRKNSGTSGVAHATPTEASLLAPPLTDTPNA
eukprot:scaffold12595_cov65-Phaeocystis_antarctica.AAC.2